MRRAVVDRAEFERAQDPAGRIAAAKQDQLDIVGAVSLTIAPRKTTGADLAQIETFAQGFGAPVDEAIAGADRIGVALEGMGQEGPPGGSSLPTLLL
jgi:hypothetical protein